MKRKIYRTNTKFQTNRDLIKKAQGGCKEAKEELVLLNAGLVEKLVRKYMGDSQDYDDLFQTANLALLNAIERFDLSKPYQFSSFAYITIRGEIFNYFRDNSTIRKKRTSNMLFKKINDYKYEYYALQQKFPTNQMIADYLDEDIMEIENTILENQPLTYLSDTPKNANIDVLEMTVESIISNDNHKDYEVILLNQVIEKNLTDEEYSIFNHNLSGLAKREISQILGVSESKINYTLKRVTKKLSEILLNA